MYFSLKGGMAMNFDLLTKLAVLAGFPADITSVIERILNALRKTKKKR